MNIFEFNDFTVLMDYAHNPHGVKALGKFVKTYDASSRIGVITGVGDRRDEDIIALGEEAARIFDEIIIRHDEDMRGRTYEELDRLLTTGIYRVNRQLSISYFGNECEAVEKALELRRPKSLIVILIENVQAVTECLLRHQQMEEQELMSMVKAV